MNIISWAEYPYISSTFHHEKDGVMGETVLPAYKIFEIGGRKLAFVGATTPEALTKSSPGNFQDGNGNYIYGIAGGEDGAALYAAVQSAIDAAKAELNGVTLESLVVAERVARAVKVAAKQGKLDPANFPLLMHVNEILVDKKEVNIPWEDFTFKK